ncbi:MAG TPA: M1 family metallopeptidase [Bryobacteraceae bacterium]|nr:M1 family metallopeptidase [Bryobacteraceae bacterium]
MWRLCLALIACLSASAQAPRIASYDIDARLDPKTRGIHGRQVLTWLNDSPDEIRELQFHLYMNAFRNERSTVMREAGGWLAERLKERNEWGWIDVKSIRLENGPDLTKAIRYIQPDDGNKDDQTVMAVTLPQPVKPGATIRVAMDFFTKLPRGVRRTGWHGDYYFVAQWFPKIGVWEKAGERYSTQGRWNCHQFHLNSEFYADFGDYNVNLTVPVGYVTGATGVQQSRSDDLQAQATIYRFSQAGVHDFAWTASPKFLRMERMFDPAKEVSARELSAIAKLHGIPEAEARLDPVRMILLIQPEHAGQAERHFRALAAGLKHFGLWYGTYPYRTITCVDPPYGAGATGGMEYPTLITAGTELIAAEDEQTPEMVTVHEFGHQYWYGMVATNEFEEAWLDEGFNTYSTSKILDKVYGPQTVPIRLQRIPVGGVLGLPKAGWDTLNRGVYLFQAKTDTLARNSWEYASESSYGVNVYMKAGLVLRTLEGYLGQDTMARVMRTYFQRWKYKHPATKDFIAVANEVSGQDVKWFFDQFFYGSNVVDYAVESVKSKKDEPKKGQYTTTVRLRREGEAVVPVDVKVRFKNGETVWEKWDGKYRWTDLKVTKAAETESVEIDPGRKIVLDVSFANNSWTSKPAQAPFVKWTANLLFWAQNLLLFVSSLA